jgi:glycosyltransferase involved in cell wall biosynthesis
LYEKSKIAFFKTGDFSLINSSVQELLIQNFPEFELTVIDVSGSIPWWNLLAFFHCMRLYGFSILTGKRALTNCYRRTPYYFTRIRNIVRKKYASTPFRFTLQTQSLFDLSLPGTPHFVYTDHTHLANKGYPAFNPARLYAQSWIDCEKEIYQHATLVFTMSSNIQESIIRDYSCARDKVKIIYCGANVSAQREEQLSDDRYRSKNILFAGVDWERKGGKELVAAFRKVKEAHPDASLTIVGCGPRVLLPGVHVKGWLAPEQVKTNFEQASVFCLPTRIEPFGVVFLEAMAHKLPVIATGIGAIPDFVMDGENGFLVQPDNIDQLADRIIKLLDSPELCKKMGQSGHHLFWERYNWPDTGRRMRDHIGRHFS